MEDAADEGAEEECDAGEDVGEGAADDAADEEGGRGTEGEEFPCGSAAFEAWLVGAEGDEDGEEEARGIARHHATGFGEGEAGNAEDDEGAAGERRGELVGPIADGLGEEEEAAAERDHLEGGGAHGPEDEGEGEGDERYDEDLGAIVIVVEAEGLVFVEDDGDGAGDERDGGGPGELAGTAVAGLVERPEEGAGEQGEGGWGADGEHAREGCEFGPALAEESDDADGEDGDAEVEEDFDEAGAFGDGGRGAGRRCAASSLEGADAGGGGFVDEAGFDPAPQRFFRFGHCARVGGGGRAVKGWA